MVLSNATSSEDIVSRSEDNCGFRKLKMLMLS